MAENSELVSFLERRAVLYYGELTRVDSKCNTLLGLSSAGLALLVVFATGVAPLPVASRLLVALAVLSVVAAILVLLRLSRPSRALTYGVHAAVSGPPEDFHASMGDLVASTAWRSTDVYDLASLVLRRMREIRLAADLLALAILVLLPVPLIGLFA